MKLTIISDSHCEGHKDQGVSFVDSVIPADSDVLVLAGDIFYLKNDYWPKLLLKKFCDKFKDVIFTPGNHCYYGTSVARVETNLHSMENWFPNLHILRHCEVHVIQGRRFLGGTLWFRHDPMNPIYADLLNDFSLIKGFVPWVYAENETTIRGLENNLKEGDIIVTHHLPSDICVAEQYRGDNTNRFFVCDLSNLIIDRKPDLWICGHSHIPVDTILGNTRIYSNPFGYLSERDNPNFDKRLYINV